MNVEQWTEARLDSAGPVPDPLEVAALEELRSTGLVQTWDYRYRYYDDGEAYLVAVPYEDEPRDLYPHELAIWLGGVSDALRHMRAR